MKTLNFLACVFFLLVAGHQVAGYGTTWEFGRFGMPKTILSADDRHYADGSDIDPISLAIANGGNEEEFYLAGLSIIAALTGYSIHAAWTIRKARGRVVTTVPVARCQPVSKSSR